MKKIIFLVDHAVNMGPENVVLDICRAIDRKNYLPIIFSLRREDKDKSIEYKFAEIGVEIIHFNLRMVDLEVFTWKAAITVKNAFLEKRGDILHAHCYHPQLVASLIKNIKTVATLHNISGEDFVMKKGIFLGTYMKWRFNHSLSSIDRVVAISDYMVNYYGSCKRIVKIPNGVSLKRDKTFQEKEFKESLGIPCNLPIIIVSGSISTRKNVSFIVEELKQSDKDFICLIIGEGDKKSECESIAGKDTRFRFEGFKKNISDYLSIANYYISASLSEGLPLSVLEALNMGVPSLLSDIRPHKEIVANMDVDGVFCFPLKRGALLSAFNEAMMSDYNHSEIETHATHNYSASVMTRRYEEIYESL